jgi:hypothetical protein
MLGTNQPVGRVHAAVDLVAMLDIDRGVTTA